MYSIQEGKPAVFWFTGEISDKSAQNIFAAFSEGQAASEIHIAMNSLGGSFENGLFLYEAAIAIGPKLSLYNVGALHSSAAIAFLGAENRFCTEASTFLFHPVKYTWNWFVTVDVAKDLHAQCLTGERQMEAILAARTKLPKAQRMKARSGDLYLNPAEARAASVVQDFRAPPIFPGVSIQAIPAV